MQADTNLTSLPAFTTFTGSEWIYLVDPADLSDDTTGAGGSQGIVGSPRKATVTNLFSSRGANPTASVGLTAVNGVATTFLRSDGAPALSTSVAWQPGQAGGQTLKGDTASGGNLTLMSTAHATKGKIIVGTSAYDEVTNRLGVGTASPVETVQVAGAIKVTGAIAADTANSGAIGFQNSAFRFISWGADSSTKGAYNFEGFTSNALTTAVYATINSSGGVGIGTTIAPSGAMLYLRKGAGAGTDVVDSNGIAQYTSDTNATNFWFNGKTAASGGTNLTFGFALNGAVKGGLVYDTTNGALVLSGNVDHGPPYTGVCVDSAGLVGINKYASLGAQLHVVSSAAGTIGQIVIGAASRTAPLIQLQTSAGASLGNVGGSIFDHFADGTSASTNGVTEDTLYTDTTAANTLAVNGDTIEANYTAIIVASATATRQIKAYFAGTAILDSGTLTFAAAGTADIWITIIRESSTVVRVKAEFVPSGITLQPIVTYTRITGLTLTATNIIKLISIVGGTGAAAADVVAKLGKIEYKAAA